ncbi:hypothetical protein [Curvivirga sp.]|uniref:hypothetical protein n=1 Tax=Curvivirga sp. TaxID=2856848 RepID=UPI003B591422
MTISITSPYPVAFAQETTTSEEEKLDVKASLKEAGLSTLPIFLDAATEDITIKFPKVLGGGKLKFGGTIDADALQEKRFIFTSSEEGKLKWDNAFGIPFLDLEDVSMNMNFAKGEYAISLDGMVRGAFGNQPKNVIIDLAIEDKKITDFTLSAPDSTLALSSIPEMKKIPGVKTFKVAQPTISKNSIGGQVQFQGQVVDAVVFNNDDPKNWIVALRLDKPLRLGSLIGIKKGLLNEIALPRATLFSSNEEFEASVDDLPLALQQFLEEGAFGEEKLELVDGVTLETVFNPSSMPKEIKSALKTIGMKETVNLSGSIGGVFGGPKDIEISAPLKTTAGNSFSFLKKMPDAETNFFIDSSSDHSGIGISSAVQLKGGKNPMIFDVDFEYRTSDAGLVVQAAGAMRGAWKNAAGIKGFDIINPFMSVGLTETGAFDILMDGTYKMGKRDVRVAADMVLQPGAAFVPESMAFAGLLDKLPISDLMVQAGKVVKLKSGDLKKAKVEFRDLEFAFMTPGADLPPDLKEKFAIDGAGMALNGSLWVQGNSLGLVKGYASTKGLQVNSAISPFKLGPLKLEDATLLIEAGPKVDQKFQLSGAMELFKGFNESYLVSLSPSNFEFQSETNFGGAFQSSLYAQSGGLKFDPSNDFAFEAVLAANYTKAFQALLNASLKGLKKTGKELKKAEEDVQNAQAKVNDLNVKIDRAVAEAKKAKEKAVSSIKSAERKVASLKREIDEAKKKAHDAKKDLKKALKKAKAKKAKKATKNLAKYEAKEKSLRVAKKSADWALAAAKKAAKNAPNTSPKVIALQAEMVTEKAALETAEGVLKGLRAANSGVEKAIKAAASSSFKINSLGAAGSLQGITSGGKSGEQPVLIVDVDIAGKNSVFRQSIAPDAKDFNKLANGIAKLIAKQLVKAVQ